MKNTNNQICLIYQPLGIGDVFYCQGIGKHYLNKGYRVIWPLASHVMYLKNYIDSPGIEFIDIASDFPEKEKYMEQYNDPWNLHPMNTEGDFVFLSLSNAQYRVKDSSLMISKYELVGLDFHTWRDNFNFIRNTERENNLYYNILGLNDDEPYVFLNKKYGTPPNYNEAPFSIDTNNKIIEMQFIPGDNLFDWLKVIENASMVVTVDTSYQYLMEKMDTLKATDFYCYPRNGKEDWIPIINKIFTKVNWNYFLN
jgi:hypothetical protein